jgi:hypothetical protein
MTSHTMTLNVPEDIYQRAERVARTTEQPVEQVIVGWITPPSTLDEIANEIAELDQLSDDELTEVARFVMPEGETDRLHDLFAMQRERGLTEAEQREAVALVEREDLYTLRRARALYLLKERTALPDDLRKLLDEMRHGIHPSRSTS